MKREKIYAAATVLVLLASMITSVVYYSDNKSLGKKLNDEKINSELLLSEKLSLQKQLEAFKNELNSTEVKNKELSSLIEKTKAELYKKQKALSSVNTKNGSLKKLKKQVADLNKLKSDYEAKFASLNETINKLNSEKDALNQTIASLRSENKDLTNNLALLNSLKTDNYLVETSKNKNKLTVLARKTKKMAFNFNVPQNQSGDLNFKITKPDGRVIEGKDKGISYNVVYDRESDLASLGDENLKVTKKIEMTYEPKEKLKAGLYKIEMFNNGQYIGSCNVRLR
ncbi:MAG: hypothetical protein H6605_03955 [Flavobacteriales bacterium]|nr:hypothetical protein [Flavobacteriales bacterium]